MIVAPVGASVRVKSDDEFNGWTGVVIELPGFPWRDHRRVKFDAKHGRRKPALVAVVELKIIKPSDRPGQLSLFER